MRLPICRTCTEAHIERSCGGCCRAVSAKLFLWIRHQSSPFPPGGPNQNPKQKRCQQGPGGGGGVRKQGSGGRTTKQQQGTRGVASAS